MRIDALNTSTQYLADKLGQWAPLLVKIVALNISTQYLADKPTLADGPPSESRINALNTTIPNLADELTLAN